MNKKIITFTDGGSRGNPGPSGVGVVITDGGGNLIKEYAEDIGVRTNNEAEYEAVVLALKKIKHIFGKTKTKNLDVDMKMDSELVCKQLNGEYKLKNEKLVPLFVEIWNLKTDFGKVSFVHIPREKNKEADALANQAMDKKETKPMF